MTDNDQAELADGGTVVAPAAEIVDRNPPAHVCGAAGCRSGEDLQTIRTAAGTRTLCPTHRREYRQRGGR